MSAFGHNGGPPLGGVGWQRHCWGRARAALLPRMPLEVVRRRVARAAELGLDYRTYAGIRASTGRDVVALLFSTNALRMERKDVPPPERAAHLAAIRDCGTMVLAQSPHRAEEVARRLGLDAAAAPAPLARWAEARAAVLAASAAFPADGVVLIGAANYERAWAEAARLAAFLPESRVFMP
ncbi:hypothetical protein [Roseitranquillus sediminis]|uniref:hypothetical protein n=1 Tax=Roseitranquillus sediminis TaxID=2809051 RepID=UPI001D0CD581|nr:hypothetical protein [Roseitranquillus sediminis]MBM9593117.1 hypothetical protein [Roseitranquillus sediminis]